MKNKTPLERDNYENGLWNINEWMINVNEFMICCFYRWKSNTNKKRIITHIFQKILNKLNPIMKWKWEKYKCIQHIVNII